MSSLSTQIEEFDPATYTRAPVLTLATGVSLCRALVDAAPGDLPAAAKKAAQRLKQAADAAQSAWAGRQRDQNASSDEDSRALDQEADSAWSGLRLRLLGYAALPSSEPRSPRAAKLLSTLFGSDGLSFLKSAYPEQLASMGTLLQRIQDEKLTREIDELCGTEFLPCLRGVQSRYERMVNVALRRSNASADDLGSHRRILSRAIVDYATKVCATAEPEDTKSIENVLRALRPLDAFREASASRRSPGTDAPEPTPPPPAPPTG